MTICCSQLRRIRSTIRKIRGDCLAKHHDTQHPSVSYILKLMDAADNQSDYQIYRELLKEEFLRCGLLENLEEMQWDTIEEKPDEPMAWAILADFYLFHQNNPIKATKIADVARCLALEKQRFIIHTHNIQGRIAKALGNYNELEEVLRFLVSYSPNNNKMDCNFEDDFIKNIPRDSVDPKNIKIN